MAEGGTNGMTIVFALSAIERFVRPGAVIDDARRWSTHLGVVGNEAPDEIAATIERTRIDPDFVSGEGGTVGSLAAIRQRFPTDRHVVIGTSDEDRRTAQALGWEYLSVEAAAEKAGWELVNDPEGSPD